jgi:hypothetical protein
MGFGATRTVKWMRASWVPDSSTSKSMCVPLKACSRMRWNFSRSCVEKLSRGTNTRQATKRSNGSCQRNRRSRCRSPSARMPIAVSYSASSGIWNRSSRGKVSSVCCSALARWPLGEKPARWATASTLRRSSGISLDRAE